MVPMREWHSYLERVLGWLQVDPPPLNAVHLHDDCPSARAYLSGKCDVQASSSSEGIPTLGAVKGEGWKKCFKKHVAARVALSEAIGSVPSVSAMAQQALTEASTRDLQWMQCLTARERDVLLLHSHVYKIAFNTSNIPNFHWDLGNNIDWCRSKSQSSTDYLQCISRGHKIWDIGRRRPWLGLELMRLQGFPDDVKLEFREDTVARASVREAILERLEKTLVTDTDLHSLAGNTMTVPVMMLLQVALEIYRRG